LSDKIIKLGLGEAVQRLIRVEVAHAMGLRIRAEAMAEADMLRETLNQYDLEIAFDCNADGGVPDTVEIYQQAAETSCCRLVQPDQVMTRRNRKDSSRRSSGGGSRRGRG
jgi:hypothetical protein